MLYTLKAFIPALTRPSSTLCTRCRWGLVHFWKKNWKHSVGFARSEIIVSTPPDLMSSLRTPFQRTSVHVLRHCSSETSMVSSYPATAGCSMDECQQWPDALPTTIVALKWFLFTHVSIDREHFFVEVWQSFPRWDATRRQHNCIVRRNHRNQQSSPGHKLMGGSWVGREGCCWWWIDHCRREDEVKI